MLTAPPSLLDVDADADGEDEELEVCAAKGHGLPWRGFNVRTEVCGGLVDEADPPHGLAHHDRLDSEHYRLCAEAVGPGTVSRAKTRSAPRPCRPASIRVMSIL